MKVATLLDSIDNGALALPEFQRGYVWNRGQVRGLMDSLYRGHPVGGLLTWQTRTEGAPARGDSPALQPGTVELLLDGQQRVSSLYGIIRGTPPPFFDGNERAFTDLRFHLDEEAFEFWQPVKMADDPRWVDVSDLFARGAGEVIGTLVQQAIDRGGEMEPRTAPWIARLNRIDQIRNHEFHIEKVTGEDKTVDVVVDIFNNVNSGGTKLSKGDLALAKVCAQWKDARDEFKSRLTKWADGGYDGLTLEWLLRCINATITGRSHFPPLAEKSAADIRDGLHTTEKAIDRLLNAISSRLGLDHQRVLRGVYAFPVMVRYLVERDLKLTDHRERDRLLFWYLQTAMWGRFTGSTETKLAQDLAVFGTSSDSDVDRLVQNLREERADLTVRPNAFAAWSVGARFYPVLYALTRVDGARDWGTGDRLDQFALGQGTNLHLHHIFPKRLLYDAGYDKTMVNSLANLTFLSQETNLAISDRDPVEYFPEYAARHPGAMDSHWIPMDDPELRKVEKFPRFLVRRQELLAEATNKLLQRLWSGSERVREQDEVPAHSPPLVLEDAATDSELLELRGVQEWLVAQGFDPGELGFELVDDEGDQEATLDLAWPSGLQVELSEPVALLLDEPAAVHSVASSAGFRVFADPERFRAYVVTLADSGAGAETASSA